jgi:hypothetical protein
MLVLSLAASTALAAATASSTLTDANGKHPADHATDGLFSTAWGEAKASDAVGEWVELDLGKPTALTSVSFWPGNLTEGSKSYREYSRPKVVRVLIDGKEVGKPLRLEDRMQRVDVPVSVTGRKVRFLIDETYEGIVFQELFITEVAVNFPKRDTAATVDKWLTSKEAAKTIEKFDEELGAAYEKIKANNGEDAASFSMLMSAVIDGPPYLRQKVKASVPEGYRAQAIISSTRAQTALRKLKDANAIPAIELASLRATGEEQDTLRQMAEIFAALQELQGGGNANIPYWGQTGWEVGALKSYGEPINLEIDREGNVYAADIGNNRVQRFSEKGKPDKVYGPGPDVANAWFVKGRTWYASGSKAGDGPGEWMNALDIDLIPEKEVDGWAGIDAKGRVQVFDDQGRQRISWVVRTENSAEPGLGGTAYVAWMPSKKRLYAIIGDEAVGFTLDSEEVDRFEIKDGAPNAVEVSPEGQLWFAFGDKIIQYEVGGFRHGAIMGEGLLGQDFEDMDITLDETGKLWVLTDAGKVFKFKKGTKMEFTIQAITRPIKNPRMAVRQGIVYICSDDQIERIDVSQMLLDEAAAKAKEGGGAEEEGGKKKKGKKGAEEEE